MLDRNLDLARPGPGTNRRRPRLEKARLGRSRAPSPQLVRPGDSTGTRGWCQDSPASCARASHSSGKKSARETTASDGVRVPACGWQSGGGDGTHTLTEPAGGMPSLGWGRRARAPVERRPQQQPPLAQTLAHYDGVTLGGTTRGQAWWGTSEQAPACGGALAGPATNRTSDELGDALGSSDAAASNGIASRGNCRAALSLKGYGVERTSKDARRCSGMLRDVVSPRSRLRLARAQGQREAGHHAVVD